MSRFTVEKVNHPTERKATFSDDSLDGGGADAFMKRTGTAKNLALYEENMKDTQRVTAFLRDQEQRRMTTVNISATASGITVKKPPPPKSRKNKLGWVFGVYLPTVQNIVGVIVFVRLGWMVGLMGMLQGLLMVLLSCAATFLTALSVSAIATNGIIEGGGSYFMISRNLGPESGGAIGICFFFANTFAVILYILGALEILMTYMAPEMAIFGDLQTNPLNNYRVYGSVTLWFLFTITAFGVLFVQYFAPIALISVFTSLLAMFAGAFESNEDTRNIWICLLDNVLLIPPSNITGIPGLGNATSTDLYTKEYIGFWCNGDPSGGVWSRYCSVVDGVTQCEEPWNPWNASLVHYEAGIPGVFSGIISSNLWANYLSGGEAVSGYEGSLSRGEVRQDITSSFVILTGIYFPSVTTVLAGTNFSGDLRDPQKSIPIGTIAAQITTSVLYLLLVLLYAATGHPALLRDKFGDSVFGEMFAASVSFPSKWLVMVGSFCSSLGAGLQSIASAPRLLQAVAQDEIVPFLSTFKHLTKWGEPFRALILTAIIIQAGLMIGKLDFVTPVISVFFLMCEAMVNLTCAVLTLLNTPGWRPRFKYYHWFLSSLGVFLNLIISFMVGWYYALIAFAICAFLYKYIQYKGCEKEWGDGIRGIHMSAALKALSTLKETQPHTKNWRPQVLLLTQLGENNLPKWPQLHYLAAHLKAGKGLTIAASVIEGNFLEMGEEIDHIKHNLKDEINNQNLDFFCKLICTKDIKEGLSVFIQSVGLGGLNPNTIIVAFPHHASNNHEVCVDNWNDFLTIFKLATVRKLAFLVLKGVENYPCENEKQKGTIDVWWIVHDGGMLVLLSFLIRQHKVWAECKLRIFTIAQMHENSVLIQEELEKFLYELRIEAEVFVEELYGSDVSEYVVDKTMDMERRQQILKDMRGRKASTKPTTIDEVLEFAKSHSNTENEEIQKMVHVPTVEGQDPPMATAAGATAAPDSAEEDPSGGNTVDDFIKNSKSNVETGGAADVAYEKSSISTSVNENENNPNVDPDQTVEDKDAEDGADPAAALLRGEEDTDATDRKKSIHHGKLMRMHTAVRLNKVMRKHSSDASLIILNFPAPPKDLADEENYMFYLETLTENLNRILLVRGSGREVVTIYS